MEKVVEIIKHTHKCQFNHLYYIILAESTSSRKFDVDEGHCKEDSDCKDNLKCGYKNCGDNNCCYDPNGKYLINFHRSIFRVCGKCTIEHNRHNRHNNIFNLPNLEILL